MTMTAPSSAPATHLSGRCSPVPTSAARPASPCPTGLAARSSRTTCGTSPTWSGCPCQMSPRRTAGSTSPPITDPRLAAGRQGTDPGHARPPPSRRWRTLPRAYRTPLHLRTCHRPAGRGHPVPRLARRRGVSQPRQRSARSDCEAYLAHRRYLARRARHRRRRAEPRRPAARRPGRRRPGQLPGAVHRRPGPGRPAALGRGLRLRGRRDAVSGGPRTRPQPVTDEVLQPMLAAALYLVNVLGPHAVELADQVRARRSGSHSVKADSGCLHGVAALARLSEAPGTDYVAAGEPLPLLADHHVAGRIAAGWPADDPLPPGRRWASWPGRPGTASSMPAGCRPCAARSRRPWRSSERRRPSPGTRPTSPALTAAGTRALDLAAAPVPGRRPGRHRPHRGDHHRGRGLRDARQRADGTAGRLPPPARGTGPGLLRYRLASKVVKGQPLGGTDDEWVVIEPVYRAVGLAEQLHDNPR